MAHNKLYRNFIILQEDERGYSRSNDKALSGYAKVEAKGDKCKVSFYAQNLKKENDYSMVLICCKRDLKQLIDLGPLAINEVGKGDTSKEYYVNNIAGLGISYEKISGAAICKVKGNETEFIMHGFMNGEESTDNWRKFKLVKVDSKRYINKLDAVPKKNDDISPDIASKAVISQQNASETKLIKEKSESELTDRKKDDTIVEIKENIELEHLEENNSKVEDEQKNRVPEKHEDEVQTTDTSEVDRNKCKETNKCDKDDKCHNYDKHDKHQKCDKDDKYDKCDKHEKCDKDDKYDKCDKHEKCDKDDKYDKCDKHEKCDKDDKYYKCDKYEKYEKQDKYDKYEDIEEVLNKLFKKLDTYDGVMDIKISHIHEDIIVYGFIKDKNDCNCKWKKFKLEKKCRNVNEDFNIIQSNAKRLEENFTLDKLTEIDKSHRLDIIDFDEYENDIQQANLNNTISQVNLETTTSQSGVGTMGQLGTGTMWQPGMGTTGQLDKGATMDQTVPKSTDQLDTGMTISPIGTQAGSTTTGQLDFSDAELPISNNTMDQMDLNVVKKTTISTDLGQLDTSDMEQPTAQQPPQVPQDQETEINGEVGQYFVKLAEGFQPYSGKLTDINYCKWYKIDVNSIEDLSDDSNYNQYTLAYYPMLNYYPYISKEGHFLLGYKCNKNGEMQYIVYGIPGSKEKNDQPYGGRTGFVTWTSDNKNGRGYWLMFYDFKNSSIVIPTK